MRSRLFCRYVLFFLAVTLTTSCQTTLPAGSVKQSIVSPQLFEPSYLFEVVRHLYRWHLDEAEVERIISAKKFIFWVRNVEPKLDAGDQSVFGEILLPQLNLSVKVKKADYSIKELGTLVKSDNFKIVQITRGAVPSCRPLSFQEIGIDMKEMRDYLFRTRNQREYPSEQLIERLRQALRKEVAQEGIVVDYDAGVEQIVNLAPLSPVANETWVFWEAGRKLFYFASDIDLANPAVWEHETLTVRIFDVDEQVVVSHEEAPGSNRFLTRYEVGRALYNSIVLGRRLTVQPYHK